MVLETILGENEIVMLDEIQNISEKIEENMLCFTSFLA